MHITNEQHAYASPVAGPNESQIAPHAMDVLTKLMPDSSGRKMPLQSPLIDTKSLERVAVTSADKKAEPSPAELGELPMDIRRRIAKMAVKDAYRSAFAEPSWKSPVLLTATMQPHPDGPAINAFAPNAIGGNHLANAGSRNLPRGVASLTTNHEMLVPVKLDENGKPQHVRSVLEGDPRMSYAVAYAEHSGDLHVGRMARKQSVRFSSASFPEFSRSLGIEHAPTTQIDENTISIKDGELRNAAGKADLPALQIRRAALTPDHVLDDTMHAVATSAKAAGTNQTPIEINASSQRYLQVVQANYNRSQARQLIHLASDGTRSVGYDQGLTPQPSVGGLLIGERTGFESTLQRTIKAEHLNAQFVRNDNQAAFDEADV